MSVQLRGHHLLCLLGFRGMGYSPAFAENMAQVYERLRAEPATKVRIVRGPDALCVCYPENDTSHCDAPNVHERDDEVLQRLGFQHGDEAAWQDILTKIGVEMRKKDIRKLCATCPWLPYGLCEAGVARIKAGEEMPPLPVNA